MAQKGAMGQIAESHPPLPQIVRRFRDQLHKDITIRGGDGTRRCVQPDSFRLSCPNCGTVKEARNIRLYTTRVRSILCTLCTKSSVASKWSCTCATRWLQCERHRAIGFACGRAKANSHPFAIKSRAHLAHRHFIASTRAARLGALGAGDWDKPSPTTTTTTTCTAVKKGSAIDNSSSKKKMETHESSGTGTNNLRKGDAQAIMYVRLHSKRPSADDPRASEADPRQFEKAANVSYSPSA